MSTQSERKLMEMMVARAAPCISLSKCQRTRRSTLFPYTTLFRSFAARNPPRRCRHDASRSSKYSRAAATSGDRKSTRLNSSHMSISYAVFCLKKKNGQYHFGLQADVAPLQRHYAALASEMDEHPE